MKFARYATDQGPKTCLVRGGPDNFEFVDLEQGDDEPSISVMEALCGGAAMLARIEQAAQRGKPLARRPERFLAPIPKPGKILCIGLNYADHAAETGATVGDEPVVFNKLPTTIRGCGDEIVLPAVSREVDYEAELVVVIGKKGKQIPIESWSEYVAGYTCGNDVSARDWQKGKPGKQWLLGKSFDSFGPIGPYVVSRDEIPDPSCLLIMLRLNGETMQSSNTNQLIFDVPYLINYLSQICTLEPGDLIFTGTPPGVGMARKPPVFLKPGDTVAVEIGAIGVLTNTVV